MTVRLQAAGEEVTVVVEDTGHGIEPEHLSHLFERFYRTDWARAKDSGGTGLGLAIIKEIVEAHGGTVSVTSQVDKASCPSKRLAAVTILTLFFGLYGSGAWCPPRFFFDAFSPVAVC